MSVNPGCFCRGHNKNGLYTVGDMTRQWGFPGWGDQTAAFSQSVGSSCLGLWWNPKKKQPFLRFQIVEPWLILRHGLNLYKSSSPNPRDGDGDPSNLYLATFGQYLAWVLRWYAYSAACFLRVSRWSIVLKAFRGSQRWGRSSTDGIDRTSELVILWASFAWIYSMRIFMFELLKLEKFQFLRLACGFPRACWRWLHPDFTC